MLKLTLLAGICALVVGASTPSYAASRHHSHQVRASDQAAPEARGVDAFAYQPGGLQPSGSCWVPEYSGSRSDSRNLGHYGSCSEPHARPFK